MIEMRIYGIVPDKGPQVYNIAPSLIAEILDGCIPPSSSEFRDAYMAWTERYAPGAMPPEEWTPDRVPPEWAERFEPEGKLYFSRGSALIAMWQDAGTGAAPTGFRIIVRPGTRFPTLFPKMPRAELAAVHAPDTEPGRWGENSAGIG